MNLKVAFFGAGLGLCLVVGCGGGGSKREPLVADSTSNATADDNSKNWSTPEPEADADAGAGTGTSAGAPTAAHAEAGAQAAAPAGVQGNDEGAQALLKQFVSPSADHAALTRSLRPTASDYKAMFDAATASKVEAAQAKDWASNKAVIKPKATQTEVKVWSATGAELAAGKGNAREFPEGYRKVAKHLAPSVLFFRFKFVESGKEQGTAYDGLAFVNGRWVIAPKPWKAIDGSRDDADDSGDTKPKSKPKPKKKKKP